MTARPFEPVIKSLDETDLYKFTMWQAMLHQCPSNHAEYRFVCRGKPEFPLAVLAGEVNEQLDHLCSLRFSDAALDYLGSLRFMKPDFIEFLRIFHFQRRFIRVWAEGDDLCVVADGPQVHTMGFEIYLLAIVSECYYRRLPTEGVLAEGRRRLQAKLAKLRDYLASPQAQGKRHPFDLFDFGLRRRYSGAWHNEVVSTLKSALPLNFKGTSNVFLAREHKIVSMGTQGHEWFQTYQAIRGVQLRYSQSAALNAWLAEYEGDLGTALTDVVGMRAFLSDFTLLHAKVFDGLRHDSGDPVWWGELALAHYEGMRIDAHAKRLTFSDGLDIDKAIALHQHFGDRVQLGFGIGTNLTNDLGVKPLNIVMKLVRCNGQSVAKLSDAPGKTLCEDQTFLAYLRQVFNHPAA